MNYHFKSIFNTE